MSGRAPVRYKADSEFLALVARETVAKGARDNPGVRITMGTVRGVQAEPTDSVVYVTVHADGDPDSVEINAVSTTGPVAVGDRVALTWTPPHGVLVTGRLTQESGAACRMSLNCGVPPT